MKQLIALAAGTLIASLAHANVPVLVDFETPSSFASIQLQPTELYALSADAQNDLTLKNLDTLSANWSPFIPENKGKKDEPEVVAKK